MGNRIVLIVLCVISLGWISYVGYDIYFQRDRLDPELVFNASDQELLVINKTDEFPAITVSFPMPEEIQSLLTQFVNVPRNERIFVSQKRPILLIESPHYWNRESVITYLRRKGITYTQKDKKLFINGHPLFFKYHFLLYSTKELTKNERAFSLPDFDKQATAVVIHSLAKHPFVTEIYKQENGIIAYQTTYDNRIQAQKVDDKNVFAAYLPSELNSYHFYEKQYAIATGILPKNSPMVEWLNYGLVQFNYKGKNVLMTDSKIGEDPINTLNTHFAKDTATFQPNELIRGIQLTDNFPSSTQRGFYLTKIGDKTIFSENLDLNKRLVADYELGNTLLMNEAKTDLIYGKLPAKVAERYITPNEMYAVSVYANISTKDVLELNQTVRQKEEDAKPTTDNHFTIPINGTIVAAAGKGNQQYFLTSSGQFIAVYNGKIAWQQTTDGQPLIGTIKIVDYEGNGTVYLLFNTSEHAYLFTENGENKLAGVFAPKDHFYNEVNLYRWRNATQWLYSDENNLVKHADVNFKHIKVIRNTAETTTAKVEAFAQFGHIYGLIRGQKYTLTLDLDKNRVLKKYPTIPFDALAVKVNGDPHFFSFSNGNLVEYNYNGKTRKITNASKPTMQKLIEVDNTRTYLTYVTGNKLMIYDEKGGLVKQLTIPNNTLQSYDICYLNGQLYAGFVDGLENKLYITDGNGKVLRKDLESKKYVFLSSGRNQLNAITEGNGYAVQYYNLLGK